ncbi:hypothetical protein LTR99_002889 [Exophiala xenobiotica]|uniref:F-box domain-containing protein n=1 Tax=Vermiconidia calcicola TaxID=1690605 RepID=A0AAV9QBN2_9PEZI|nr:hypothetical protein LTR92_005630 [Exophiala xenobiotica]KAK5305347.1 hypothetical protein LTR99_002889 [Exophiala xenobiotica]KAK5432201.1 hypothetical protein LTR34_005322 [Exophiala xenobiotica]KAK5538559.1 hypothetical protein LTR25_004101 [Vermiconidia calcicola]KAK5547952.1 hypothetical protein LTR23_002201 [Chaetothyriales sp. CCFEE 6169]
MDPRLGNFSLLPREIRGAIFRECVNQRAAQSLACTSSKIHEELRYFLYDQLTLIFDVNPADTSSNVRILNDQGEHWGWNATSNPIMTSQAHIKEMDKTQSLPLEKFKRIIIQLHAPDPRDPGQLVRGWFQITRLLSLLLPQREYHFNIAVGECNFVPGRLNQGYNLPEVCFRVLDTKHVSWARERAAYQYRRLGNEETDLVDRIFEGSSLEVFLTPFRQVRRARSLTVELPESLVLYEEPELSAEISQLSELARSRKVFGQDFEEDSNLYKLESELDLFFDYTLDVLEGDAAGQLRRARFFQVCDHTVAAYSRWRWGMKVTSDGVDERRGSRVFGGCESLLTPENRLLVTRAFKARMRNWAILSPDYYSNDRIAWEDYYPGGIPPMGTKRYRAMVAELYHGGPILFKASLRGRCKGCHEVKRRDNERWPEQRLSPAERE